MDRERTVTAADGNLVLALDGEPALDVLLRELDLSLDRPQEAIEKLRTTLVGLTYPQHLPRRRTAPAPRARPVRS